MKTEENKPENPLAFPTTGNEYINNSDDSPTVGLYGGMTLRDYFAAKAFTVFCQEYFKRTGDTIMREEIRNPNGISALSYEFADAMLKQREL